MPWQSGTALDVRGGDPNVASSRIGDVDDAGDRIARRSDVRRRDQAPVDSVVPGPEEPEPVHRPPHTRSDEPRSADDLRRFEPGHPLTLPPARGGGTRAG